MKPYIIQYKGHILAFNPLYKFWHITGPKLKAAFANKLEEAEQEVDFWLARLKPGQTMHFAKTDY